MPPSNWRSGGLVPRATGDNEAGGDVNSDGASTGLVRPAKSPVCVAERVDAFVSADDDAGKDKGVMRDVGATGTGWVGDASRVARMGVANDVGDAMLE